MANPWSWNAVFETLLGTSTGALVGVGGIAWQMRTEKRERYETQLTSRLFDLNDWIKGLLPTHASLRKNYGQEVTAVAVALANISMIAREDDRKFIEKLSEVCETTNTSHNLESSYELFAFIIGTIVGWRNEYKTPEFFLNEISKKLNF